MVERRKTSQNSVIQQTNRNDAELRNEEAATNGIEEKW
jgi:hypothetical protein